MGDIQTGDDKYKYGFHDDEKSVFKSKPGLSRQTVEEISSLKGEPEWMREFRLKALGMFQGRPMHSWGPDLSGIHFDDIIYYLKPSQRSEKKWEDVPEDIKHTFERLGIPEAEKKYLAGVGAQYDSEMVYHSIKEDLKKQGVIFLGTDQALKEFPDLFREHFSTVVAPNDNKFSALNGAVWSGGSFIYVPPRVQVSVPLQAYFRINAQNMGQFERTLIIADEGSFVHYVEGCTAPIYSSDSLHSAVVEIIIKKGARVRYTTIQNWSTNVYNIVTKRAVVYGDGVMEWVDGNLGSKVTMKYPAMILKEPGARGEVLSMAFAGEGQHQDTGGRAVHLAPHTTSQIISKSISRKGGVSSFRGLVRVQPGARGAKAHVKCDALILDDRSRSDTYPLLKIGERNSTVGHEAVVRKVGEDQLFYLMSRGLTDADSMKMIVNGFIEPVAKELPMEYAVELNRLIELQLEGSVG